MKRKITNYLFVVSLIGLFFFGVNQKAEAWGKAERVTTVNSIYYLGDHLQLWWKLDATGSGASFKRYSLGITEDWKTDIVWDNKNSEDEQYWRMPVVQFNAIGSWQYSIFLGWGSSVGDNGRFYHQASWTEGFAAKTFGSFTVAEIAKPTTLASTRTSGQVDLTWAKNAQSHEVLIVRYPNTNYTAPTNTSAYTIGETIGEGTVVYKGAGTSFTDNTVVNDYVKYYYVFYSENYTYYSDGEVLEVLPYKIAISKTTAKPEVGTYNRIRLTLAYSDISTYQFFSVPFDVDSIVAAANNLDLLDYNDTTNSRQYLIYEYNSITRASSGTAASNWDLVADPTTLKAGKGYIIGFNTSLPTPVQVEFTSKLNTIVSDTSQKVLADLTESLPEDDNWYLVGSSLYDNASLTASGLNYFQKYNGTSYDVKLLSANETVPQYSSVFVQYSGTMDMAYPVSGVQSNSVSNNTQSTYILSLSDDSSTSRAIVIGAQDGDMTYQYGKDLLQMVPLTTATMDLSIPHSSGKLVVDYIEDASAQIALYNKVSDNTSYTISLSGEYTADNVILHDTYLNIDTDLKVSNYTFDGVANQPNRFTLEIVINKIPTEFDNSIFNKVSVSTESNNIIVHFIPFGSQIRVTNALGQVVRRYSSVENQLIISDLDKGIYFVTIEGEINQVVKILLNK